MSKTSQPARGTRDILPMQALLRREVMQRIYHAYRMHGFMPIETPAFENIGNIRSGDGGENEGLTFQIIKRGELNLAEVKSTIDLVDLALRYDLTLPLSRLVADNRAKLPKPFKALQYGSVWRAERPARGRYREFVQCDADIIGESGPIAEIELLMAATDALVAIGLSGFVVRLNDRRVLAGIGRKAGIAEDNLAQLNISLDKFDKIGLGGMSTELLGKGFSADAVDRVIVILRQLTSLRGDEAMFEAMGQLVDASVLSNLQVTWNAVRQYASTRDFRILLDPILVRGMGYYTGQIFEISYKDYPFSIAGGGRYDKMLASFGSKDEPACGLSLGFERIITILEEESIPLKDATKQIVVLFDEQASTETNLLRYCQTVRETGTVCSAIRRAKNVSSQLEAFKAMGYDGFVLYSGPDSQIRNFSR